MSINPAALLGPPIIRDVNGCYRDVTGCYDGSRQGGASLIQGSGNYLMGGIGPGLGAEWALTPADWLVRSRPGPAGLRLKASLRLVRLTQGAEHRTRRVIRFPDRGAPRFFLGA